MVHLGFAPKPRMGGGPLKSEWKTLFSIKSIDIYVLLCCCCKVKRVKKNDKNKNGTFSMNWPNKKMSQSLGAYNNFQF